MRFISSIFLMVMFLSNCKKDSATTFKNAKGTLTGGADGGCSSWIILQDNGRFWQPVNLNLFSVTLKGGQPVIFSFKIQDSANFCMVGETILLTAIRDQ